MSVRLNFRNGCSRLVTVMTLGNPIKNMPAKEKENSLHGKYCRHHNESDVTHFLICRILREKTLHSPVLVPSNTVSAVL